MLLTLGSSQAWNGMAYRAVVYTMDAIKAAVQLRSDADLDWPAGCHHDGFQRAQQTPLFHWALVPERACVQVSNDSRYSLGDSRTYSSNGCTGICFLRLGIHVYGPRMTFRLLAFDCSAIREFGARFDRNTEAWVFGMTEQNRGGTQFDKELHIH